MIELQQQEMTDKTINVILAHDDAVEGPWISEHINSSDIVVDRVLGSLATGSEALHDSQADVLVVACGDESNQAVALIEWWVGHYPDRPVVVLVQNSANGFVGRAFAAGADDLVVLEGQARTCPKRTQITSHSRCTRRSFARSRPASTTPRSRP